VKLDSELPADALKELVAEFKAEIKNRLGVDFPTIRTLQLEGAIKAVFQSWQNDRANLYRRLNNIPVEWGTAVNVQAMVFGNKGTTRRPASASRAIPPAARTCSTASSW
jgi:pyruvate,orthophosphate dikinase